ncbi:MAG: carbohydrate ABC transporter permease [Thermomicrobiales bacterium]|nr:carbohydrate ABC transporter permease [Thermomicrobiales bacterium]
MGTQPGRASTVISYLVLAVFAFFTLFPIYWMFVTSVKPQDAVGAPYPSFIPWLQYQPTLQPFRDIFGDGEGYGVSGMGNLALLFRNSFLSAFFSALIATTLGAMAAYALSRFRYRRWSNNNIAFWFVSQRMMPPIALVVPYFILFGRIGQLDKVTTLIVVFAAGNLPLVIWLLRDYFQDLPIEIEEAAMVDGASQYGAFLRIALPLALPGLVVAFLFAFVFAWNEFLFALTLTIDQAKTLPVQIAGNVTLRGPRYWDIAAQGLVVMLPPLVIALLVGKYIVRGLTLGAIK